MLLYRYIGPFWSDSFMELPPPYRLPHKTEGQFQGQFYETSPQKSGLGGVDIKYEMFPYKYISKSKMAHPKPETSLGVFQFSGNIFLEHVCPISTFLVT